MADCFPGSGSVLERYANRLGAVEVNSSFHRSHRLSTWLRWGASVPDSFRFSVKLPKAITHERKLVGCAAELDRFCAEAGALGDKLAVVLVQLPPKLAFDADLAAAFFAALRLRSRAAVACEPRHASWFSSSADALLEQCEVCRVAADPALSSIAALPGGWRGFSYWRLHGSPAMYRSSYAGRLESYARVLRKECQGGRETWCIFDNTAASAAAGDALALAKLVAEG